MSALPGRLGMVYMEFTPGTGVMTLIGEAKTWRFDTDIDLIEQTGLGDQFKSYLALPRKWEFTVEGNLDPSSDIMNVNIVGDIALGPCQISLYPDRTNTLRFYTGMVWPKISVEVNITQTSKFTLGGTGDGALFNF